MDSQCCWVALWLQGVLLQGQALPSSIHLSLHVNEGLWSVLYAVLCCAVLCCAVLCCAVLQYLQGKQPQALCKPQAGMCMMASKATGEHAGAGNHMWLV